jgi:hypothetical protein
MWKLEKWVQFIFWAIWFWTHIQQHFRLNQTSKFWTAKHISEETQIFWKVMPSSSLKFVIDWQIGNMLSLKWVTEIRSS